MRPARLATDTYGSRASMFARGWRLAALGIAAAMLAGCADSQPPEETIPEARIGRAQELLLPFKQQLKTALMTGLEAGPEGAIPVCRVEAGRIAAEQSIHGVRMGRTSHRLRNPDNAPAPWMEPLLAAYVAGGEQPPHRAVRLEDGRLGYVEPIYTQPMCLSCHGPAIEGSLQATIHELYPADQATGFKAEELRGLFWIELPPGPAG